MKRFLKQLLFYITLALVNIVILLGLATYNNFIINCLTLFTILTIICLFAAITISLVDVIDCYIKRKKKIKTSENEVKLKVTYTDPENPTHHPLVRLYRRKNLSLCVQASIAFAKNLKLQIKSMEQLTTED